ncbi:MAG: hypothetical protein A2X56_07870 [Nitrospirae bacterium GWC2_57_13]|jgi:extracellular factor (EF) 3-hydroxypalmitic acid methyl ester biosynthesis protein|nr:MAG: hypothetical protein A2X56_07870 [Nitrospirae bacterium GWC2_57_13]OGW42728.1 MAG: hypothetical protein A2X57_10895 [Nitrospirae bacterium GWD2_57_8]HAS54555.1 hypothetical protein [Nitrospiraceae bacterium]
MNKKAPIEEGSVPQNDDRRGPFITLDAAIDIFNGHLLDLSVLIEARTEDPGAIQSRTGQAILEMKEAAEHYERQVGGDRAAISKAQEYFQEKTERLFSQSHLMKHARTWPMGYPGDFTILEEVYDDAPHSKGIGYFLDAYFLATALAVAVRGRMKAVAGLLKSIMQEKNSPKILNLACGSCRELMELSPAIIRSSARLLCLDYDQAALDFSREHLLKAAIPATCIDVRKYNALKMTSREKNLQEFGAQDVIYSLGLFDYLRDDVVIRLFQELYVLLAPGGQFVSSFKDSERYDTFDYHWLVKWNAFLQRTEADALSLFQRAGIPSHQVRVIRESSGVVLLFIVSK